MARRPTLSNTMRDQLNTISRDDMKAMARLPLLETDDKEFGQIFMANPGAALAAKGLEVSPQEIERIREKIGGLSRPGAGGAEVAATEVEVSVKIKF